MKAADHGSAFGTVYDYIPFSRHGNIVTLAGQIPKIGPTEIHATGRCGEAVDLDTARESARIAARQVLAWIGKAAAPASGSHASST